MNIATILETFWQDILYALRTMRNNPLFTLTAVLTLALGIGGNTAIFTVIRGVLLTPLRFHEPDRLVYFSIENPKRNAREGSFTLTEFEEIRAAATTFTAAPGAFGRPENTALSGDRDNGGSGPEALKGARVSANFLDILGVHPLLGRSFLPEEDKRGGPPVAMISSSRRPARAPGRAAAPPLRGSGLPRQARRPRRTPRPSPRRAGPGPR